MDGIGNPTVLLYGFTTITPKIRPWSHFTYNVLVPA